MCFSDFDRSVTAAEAERYLGIPAALVRKWAQRGKLVPRKRVKVGEAQGDGDLGGPTDYVLHDVLYLWARSQETRRSRRSTGVDHLAVGGRVTD